MRPRFITLIRFFFILTDSKIYSWCITWKRKTSWIFFPVKYVLVCRNICIIISLKRCFLIWNFTFITTKDIKQYSPKYLTLYSLAILIVVRIGSEQLCSFSCGIFQPTIRIASEYRVRYFGLKAIVPTCRIIVQQLNWIKLMLLAHVIPCHITQHSSHHTLP